jgi:hypothetical protein
VTSTYDDADEVELLNLVALPSLGQSILLCLTDLIQKLKDCVVCGLGAKDRGHLDKLAERIFHGESFVHALHEEIIYMYVIVMKCLIYVDFDHEGGQTK